jgi:anthranilate phosphoribosyltransferase
VQTSSFSFAEILTCLLARQELSQEQMSAVMQELMTGKEDEAQAAAFLVALRMKGETAGEIAVAAQVLRQHMICWNPGQDDILDTCGTGGDGTGTFNISTATAIVVAGAGVPVVKHGNRSVSSRSGSADVLAALKVSLEGDADHARRSLGCAGLAFCFAPLFHPALKHIAGLRKRLGVPTLFNCLGPLVNPAGASRQLLGVGRLELLDLMAGALSRLGTRRSLVVHSQDGLDEVSLAGPTLVREVVGSEVRSWEWTPKDFGLPFCKTSDWKAEDAQASGRIIEGILAGEQGPCSWVVQANAAAALWLMGRVADLKEGVAVSQEAITTGKARQVLDKLRSL